MNLKDSPENKRRLGRLTIVLALLPSSAALAGPWGILLGYNNPAGSNLGLNFLYQSGGAWGFEFGVGGLYSSASENSKSLSTWGDVDVKWFPSSGLWKGYLEGGLSVSLGTSSTLGSGVAAGSPFVGGGLMYSGASVLFHVTADYKINSQTVYPSAGLGFRL
jgi:hypothetical protein